MKVIFVSVKRIHMSLVHQINTPKTESSLLQSQRGINGGIASLTLSMTTINSLQAHFLHRVDITCFYLFIFIIFKT